MGGLVSSWDTIRNMNGAPAFPLAPTLPTFGAVQVVSVIAWFVFVVWMLYTLVAAYHWFRYGHQSAVAIPALLTHVIVSLSLALFAVSGFK